MIIALLIGVLLGAFLVVIVVLATRGIRAWGRYPGYRLPGFNIFTGRWSDENKLRRWSDENKLRPDSEQRRKNVGEE